MADKPETLKLVRTEGGYAVFVSPRAQPAAVFTSGYELLDWVASRIAGWEAGRETEGEATADEAPEGDGPRKPPPTAGSGA